MNYLIFLWRRILHNSQLGQSPGQLFTSAAAHVGPVRTAVGLTGTTFVETWRAFLDFAFLWEPSSGGDGPAGRTCAEGSRWNGKIQS